MRLLLDTHVLVWYDKRIRLSAAAVAAIRDAEQVVISAATVWEVSIKRAAGSTDFPVSIIALTEQLGFGLLSMTPEHGELAGSLPMHHRDPFDRMLVAQAMVEGLTLVTHDATLGQYAVPLLRV